MTESDPRPRSVTVVVEWDNVRLSELGRARRMLAELDRQAEALARAGHREWQGRPVRVDIVLVFDSQRFDEATVRQAVADSSAPGTSLPMRLLPSPGASYYEQKNAGAAAATGDVVVFLDSDVVPEDGWLESILRPFALPWVQCAAGNSYVETGSVYEKAFALTWFFPLRDHDGRRGLVAKFYANNVAFRRDFFLARRFPDEGGLARGACQRLAESIRAEGRKIAYDGSARVSHPPPNGFRHYVERGVAQGRDNLLGGWHASRSPLASLRRWATAMSKATSRIWRGRKAVDLGALELPGALLVSWGYCTLMLVGEAGAMIAPQFMRRRFQL
jgi:glycosyltransferase involved in cell wall biosynthesis